MLKWFGYFENMDSTLEHRIKLLESLHYDPASLLNLSKLDLSKGAPLGLNGQLSKKYIFDDLFNFYNFDFLIETGTYTGLTTKYFAHNYPKLKIFTIELDRYSFLAACSRLKDFKNVFAFHGSSVEHLPRIIKKNSIQLPEKTNLWYLDAHWNDYCPLQDEVRLIMSLESKNIIVIDDFNVPLDEGYSYDIYTSKNKRLILDYNLISNHIGDSSYIYWPTLPSSNDTGSKRGTVVISNFELNKFESLAKG